MESIDQSSLENLEKTVSFKLAKDDLLALKGQCEQEGSTVSDFIRKRLRPPAAPDQGQESLRRELRTHFDLELAQDKLARTQNELVHVQQDLAIERDKRKKLRKRLAEAETTLTGLKSEADGGLSGLVTSNPALSELLGNVLVRLAESPKIHKTIGTLMGVSEAPNELSEDDQALLTFGRELSRQLSSVEFTAVVKICSVLMEHKRLIEPVLNNLQKTVTKPPSPAATAPVV